MATGLPGKALRRAVVLTALAVVGMVDLVVTISVVGDLVVVAAELTTGIVVGTFDIGAGGSENDPGTNQGAPRVHAYGLNSISTDGSLTLGQLSYWRRHQTAHIIA
ncbi:MAG: hypothetical protein ABJZ69_09675 [Hyphomicrobiales bacterium]